MSDREALTVWAVTRLMAKAYVPLSGADRDCLKQWLTMDPDQEMLRTLCERMDYRYQEFIVEHAMIRNEKSLAWNLALSNGHLWTSLALNQGLPDELRKKMAGLCLMWLGPSFHGRERESVGSLAKLLDKGSWPEEFWVQQDSLEKIDIAGWHILLKHSATRNSPHIQKLARQIKDGFIQTALMRVVTLEEAHNIAREIINERPEVFTRHLKYKFTTEDEATWARIDRSVFAPLLQSTDREIRRLIIKWLAERHQDQPDAKSVAPAVRK